MVTCGRGRHWKKANARQGSGGPFPAGPLTISRWAEPCQGNARLSAGSLHYRGESRLRAETASGSPVPRATIREIASRTRLPQGFGYSVVTPGEPCSDNAVTLRLSGGQRSGPASGTYAGPGMAREGVAPFAYLSASAGVGGGLGGPLCQRILRGGHRGSLIVGLDDRGERRRGSAAAPRMTVRQIVCHEVDVTHGPGSGCAGLGGAPFGPAHSPHSLLLS